MKASMSTKHRQMMSNVPRSIIIDIHLDNISEHQLWCISGLSPHHHLTFRFSTQARNRIR